MSNFTTYVEEQIVNWIVGGEDMPIAHTNVYVALHIGDPTNDGIENEVNAMGYTRAETSANGDWSRNGNQFENAVDIEFPEAEEEWGDISHFSIWDGPDNTDNPLGQSELNITRNVSEGDAPVFRSGTLTGEIN